MNGQDVGQLTPTNGWQRYTLALPSITGPLTITLRSTTFRPRDYDRASPDNRALGVRVRLVAVQP